MAVSRQDRVNRRHTARRATRPIRIATATDASANSVAYRIVEIVVVIIKACNVSVSNTINLYFG